MTEMKDTFLKYWFAGSALLLTVFLFLFLRRGRTIEDLKADAEKQLIAQELNAIRKKAEGSQDDFKKAQSSYNDLKRRHADTLKRLGVDLSSE